MKKLKYVFSFILLFFISILSVDAASFKISTNKSTVVVGNTVKITVAVSGNDAAGWEYCLNYDTSVFTLSSATSDTGGKCVKTGSTLTGYKSVTFTLKATKSGSSKFALSGAAIYNDDLALISSSYNEVTVKAKTQAEIEASYSTNDYLKSLSVEGYEIDPEFNKDILNYTLEVENDVEKITIKATKSDSSASISGTGEKELTEGVNKFSIVVTAEKGNKRIYVIEIIRKELNPIYVSVDGKDYTIVRKKDVMTAPIYYSSTEIEIDDEIIPAYKSDITGYVLVGLKDENGDISLYRYDELSEKYYSYQQLSTESITLIPLETDELIKGYENKKDITINDNNVKVYGNSINDDFVLIYGMNASNGEINWYKYDIKESTLQRYEILKDDNTEERTDVYFILTIVFVGLSLISILLVIVLLSMNSKLRKKNDKLIDLLKNSKKENTKELKEEVDSLKEKEVINKSDDLDNDALLSKREQRRIDKQKEKEQQDELRRMQEDFLKTEVNDIIVDDVELEESTPVRKRGKKKK